MYIKNFLDKLNIFLSNKLNVDTSNIDFDNIIEQSPKHVKNFELTINYLKLSKQLNLDNDLLKKFILKFIKDSDLIEDFEEIKIFINFRLKIDIIFKNVYDLYSNYIIDNQNILEDKQKKRIMIEYSSPNTNKPMHLGHVRNNIIGMSLINLFKKIGHTVYAVNLINDRGIHICKSMIAYKLFGKNETPEDVNLKGDHFVGKFYVKFNKEIKKQINNFKNINTDFQNKDDTELFHMVELGKQTEKMLRDWENKDKDVINLWNKMNNWVIDGFYKTYDRMGAFFDKIYFESEVYEFGKMSVLDGLKKGFFKLNTDGSIYADLTNNELGKKILLRSDGTSVYITQDIGLTIKKYKDYNIDQQIWVVGNEQRHHFKVLFNIMNLMDDCKCEYYHLAHGMVELPYGKMKSREGTVVDADDIFDSVFDIAKKMIINKNNTPLNNIDHCADIISMGAIKFMFLKFNAESNIMFDPNAILKLEGDTGSYIQYTCVRINSIIKKFNCDCDLFFNRYKDDIDWNLLNTSEERNLAINLLKYVKILKESTLKMDCSILSNYLIKIARCFNIFYKTHTVIVDSLKNITIARIALCIITRDIINDGCKILTIDIPDSM